MPAPLPLFVAAILSGLVAADWYPTVLTAHSPTIKYLPDFIHFNKTTTTQGVWNQTYTGAAGRLNGLGQPDKYNWEHGTLGPGDQLMWATAANGEEAIVPSLNYSFFGTGIRFKGYWNEPSSPGAADASVELTVDGRSTTFNGQQGDIQQLVTLAEDMALEIGHHDVQLVVRKGTVSIVFVEPTLYFPNISLATIVLGETRVLQQQAAASFEAAGDTDTSPSIIFGAKAINSTKMGVNPALKFVEPLAWVGIKELLGIRYGHAGTSWWGNPVTVDLGSGNFFVRVNGTMQPRNVDYKIEIIPPPPERVGTFTSNSFSAPWSGNATMYLAALDPTVSYSLSVENISPPNSGWTTVHSIELWKGNATDDTVPQGNSTGVPDTNETSAASGNSDNGNGKSGNSETNTNTGGASKSNAGAIAGGVIGGLVAVILSGILGFFLGKRSVKALPVSSSNGAAMSARFEVDNATATATVTAQRLVSTAAGTTLIPTPYPIIPPFPPSIAKPDPPPFDKRLAVQEAALRRNPPEASKPVESSTSATTSTPVSGGSDTSSNVPRAPAVSSAAPASSVDQEEDAGALVPVRRPGRVARRIVPPRYDPAWAGPLLETHSETDTDADSDTSR